MLEMVDKSKNGMLPFLLEIGSYLDEKSIFWGAVIVKFLTMNIRLQTKRTQWTCRKYRVQAKDLFNYCFVLPVPYFYSTLLTFGIVQN